MVHQIAAVHRVQEEEKAFSMLATSDVSNSVRKFSLKIDLYSGRSYVSPPGADKLPEALPRGSSLFPRGWGCPRVGGPTHRLADDRPSMSGIWHLTSDPPTPRSP